MLQKTLINYVQASKATRLAFQLYRAVNIFESQNQDQHIDNNQKNYCQSGMQLGGPVISATIVKRLDDSKEPPISAQIGFRRHLSEDEQVSQAANYAKKLRLI